MSTTPTHPILLSVYKVNGRVISAVGIQNQETLIQHYIDFKALQWNELKALKNRIKAQVGFYTHEGDNQKEASRWTLMGHLAVNKFFMGIKKAKEFESVETYCDNIEFVHEIVSVEVNFPIV